MLHLIYYLNCLHGVEDVRGQNIEAFELTKLSSQSPEEILNNYYGHNKRDQEIIEEEDEDEGMEMGSDEGEDLLKD